MGWLLADCNVAFIVLVSNVLSLALVLLSVSLLVIRLEIVPSLLDVLKTLFSAIAELLGHSFVSVFSFAMITEHSAVTAKSSRVVISSRFRDGK